MVTTIYYSTHLMYYDTLYHVMLCYCVFHGGATPGGVSKIMCCLFVPRRAASTADAVWGPELYLYLSIYLSIYIYITKCYIIIYYHY